MIYSTPKTKNELLRTLQLMRNLKFEKLDVISNDGKQKVIRKMDEYLRKGQFFSVVLVRDGK